MEQRTIDDGELRQWIDEWGEESHDDILASDDEADIANRILEHHTHGEYPDDVDWNDAWESLRSIIEPALEHVHGFFPDGAETLARYVREIDMGIDPDTGEDLERAAIEEPAFRTSFRIRAMADATPRTNRPSTRSSRPPTRLPARRDLRRRRGARRLAQRGRIRMAPPHARTARADRSGIRRVALAVIAVSMRYAPDATRAMIATDVLGPDLPTMGGLRDIIGTPERDVPVDTLITDLVGQWPDATPDRDTLIDRDHAAWRILSPIQQNAPAPVEGTSTGCSACSTTSNTSDGRARPAACTRNARSASTVRPLRVRGAGHGPHRGRVHRTGGTRGHRAGQGDDTMNDRFVIDDVEMRRSATWPGGPHVLSAELPDGRILGHVIPQEGEWLWRLADETEWHAPRPVEATSRASSTREAGRPPS